jgi:histidyl-tRNA synthetase
MVVEAEILAAASDVLMRLGFNDFTIRLNHRQTLAAALAETAPDQHEGALVALDKLDKIGKDGVYEELKARGIESAAPRKLLELLWQTNEKDMLGNESDQITDLVSYNLEMLSGLQDFAGDHEQAKRGIIELRQILDYSSKTAADGHIKIDPSLARGLSYYTGAIMEIRVRDLPGSLGGGGRYDNLVGMFLGKDVPACGFSLGLERIIVVMTERNMFPAELVSSPADVMVTIWNEDSVGESLALASELRSGGLRVDLYPEADKMGKQFKHASARGIPFVAIVGDEERARGEVAIKDLSSGEQRSVKREDVEIAIRERAKSGVS